MNHKPTHLGFLFGALSLLGCGKTVNPYGYGWRDKPYPVTINRDVKNFSVDVASNPGPIPSKVMLFDRNGANIAGFEINNEGNVSFGSYFDLHDTTKTSNRGFFLGTSTEIRAYITVNDITKPDTIYVYGPAPGATLNFNVRGLTYNQAYDYMNQFRGSKAYRVE